MYTEILGLKRFYAATRKSEFHHKFSFSTHSHSQMTKFEKCLEEILPKTNNEKKQNIKNRF